MSIKKVPTITIRTTDYHYISKMNNQAVVNVFLGIEQQRYSHKLPSHDSYNSYIVRRFPHKLVVCLSLDTEEIYQVIFIPAEER